MCIRDRPWGGKWRRHWPGEAHAVHPADDVEPAAEHDRGQHGTVAGAGHGRIAVVGSGGGAGEPVAACQ